jgi:hypothetical protein
MHLLLTLAVLFGSSASLKKPVHEALEAWARTRKLYLEKEGAKLRLKATKSDCYHGVEVALAPYSAKASGRDGHDCTEPERFEMAGFTRPSAPPVWVVTFDSVYGSNIAAYVVHGRKLRAEKSISLPTAADLLRTDALQHEDAQKALRSVEPHYYLTEKGLRAELDSKDVRQLCALQNLDPDACRREIRRFFVLAWNPKTSEFEADEEATAHANASAPADPAPSAVATPEQEQDPSTPRRRPLR